MSCDSCEQEFFFSESAENCCLRIVIIVIKFSRLSVVAFFILKQMAGGVSDQYKCRLFKCCLNDDIETTTLLPFLLVLLDPPTSKVGPIGGLQFVRF